MTGPADPAGESFDEFRKSFSYGSRSDLSFKFLSRLDVDEAAEFLRLVLHEIGESYDSGSMDALVDLVYEWQVKAYTPPAGSERPYVYDDRPFAPLPKPLSECNVGVVSSSGHYVAGNDPEPFGVEDMTVDEAMSRITEFLRSAPDLSPIPSDTPVEDLRVRHPGYDIRSTTRDEGVALPRDVLVDLEREGRIGSLSPMMYSFVGAAAQGRLRKVVDGWIDRWRGDGMDVLLLVPV